jgi:beta-N-acetylhexosaminidase
MDRPGDSSPISRRQLLAGLGSAALAAALARCGSVASPVASAPVGSPAPTGTSEVGSPTSSASAPPSPSASAAASSNGSDDATLRRKIAGLLVVGFRGDRLPASSWITRALANDGLGGVILFDRDQLTGQRRNIVSPTQVTTLVRTIRGAASGRSVVVSIDQEGGRVARLNPGDGFPATRSEAEIGALDSATTARSWARAIASNLADIGVNLNFAPVVDLNVNPRNPAIGALGRSFSADPDVVVGMASQEIRAHHDFGVRTTLKHFPGIGSATGNTDFGIVDVSTTWKRGELAPFRELIASGGVDAVMVGHVLNRQLDPSLPASLSSAVVTELLRGELGWTGAVVSDDMQAAAITKRYGQAEAIARAFEAGVDLLVFANQQVFDEDVVRVAVDSIVGLVESGRLDEGRIDASLARIATLTA